MSAKNVRVVKPSTLGLADDGELWFSRGGDVGLLKSITSHLGVLKRDWFVNAEWADEKFLTEIPLNREFIKNLHPVQDYVNVSTFRNYMNDPTRSVDAESFYNRYPMIFKYDGEYFIFNGTHRIVASMKSGESFVKGWIVSVDDGVNLLNIDGKF